MDETNIMIGPTWNKQKNKSTIVKNDLITLSDNLFLILTCRFGHMIRGEVTRLAKSPAWWMTNYTMALRLFTRTSKQEQCFSF